MDYLEKIRTNIKILDIKIYEEFFGIKIIIKIQDNNKTYFKNKTLKRESFGVSNTEEMDEEVESAIRKYIFNNYPVYKNTYLDILAEWKNKHGI